MDENSNEVDIMLYWYTSVGREGTKEIEHVPTYYRRMAEGLRCELRDLRSYLE